MKKYNDKQIKELPYLNEWCITIIDFMESKITEKDRIKMIREILDKAFSNKNLKGIKSLFKELNDWAKYMTIQELEELNLKLRSKFGEDLLTYSKKDNNEVKKIIKKGIISNDDEYRILLNYVEEIFANTQMKEELLEANKLLANYAKK